MAYNLLSPIFMKFGCNDKFHEFIKINTPNVSLILHYGKGPASPGD